jgi:hypothetical protein
MPRRGRHCAALAVILALVVPAAPITRTVRATCDVCPAGCPMHRKAKPSCHRAPAGDLKAERHCGGAAGLARPGCGRHDEVVQVALAPAILVDAAVSWPVPPPAPFAAVVPAPVARGTDPPDTPPPILSL